MACFQLSTTESTASSTHSNINNCYPHPENQPTEIMEKLKQKNSDSYKTQNNLLFDNAESTLALRVKLSMIMQSRTPAAQPFLKAANTKLGTHTSTPFSTGRELAFVDERGMRSGNMSDREMDKMLQIVGEQ